jgi:YidC/Oxa1 family membrane protein insertase
MFTTIIVQPIFNLLVLIYAILPGHNFGLAIVIFTVLVRLLMWPLVKKQLHQTKLMRQLQPDLKRIKVAAKGDKQRESVMMMELYKERGINPFSSFGIVILQLPIFIALYSGLRRIVNDPHTILTFSYSWLHNLSWLKQLGSNIHIFDATLFRVVDLTRAAISKSGGHSGIYWPAMLIVIASAVMQYYQSKQLLPDDKDNRGLRKILKDAGTGKQADQSEVNAAVGRSTRYLIPGLIFFVTVNIPSALSLYWLTSGLTAFIQQSRILGKDEEEMDAVADRPSSTKVVIEGEVLPPKPKATKSKKPGNKGGNKRRKR